MSVRGMNAANFTTFSTGIGFPVAIAFRAASHGARSMYGPDCTYLNALLQRSKPGDRTCVCVCDCVCVCVCARACDIQCVIEYNL